LGVMVGGVVVLVIQTLLWYGFAWRFPTSGDSPASHTKSSSSFSLFKPKPGKLAMEAYSALRKIEAAIETGISYVEYRKQLGDVWFNVKAYLESAEASSLPNLTDSIRGAMQGYNDAAAVWKARQEAKNDYQRSYLHVTECPAYERDECERGKALVAALPNVKTFVDGSNRTVIALEDEMQSRWRAAQDHLRSAKTIVNE